MMKPKEYWINKGDNCFMHSSDQPLDTFYDTVLTKPHPLAIHVIEKSAYNKAIAALQRLKSLVDDDFMVSRTADDEKEYWVNNSSLEDIVDEVLTELGEQE